MLDNLFLSHNIEGDKEKGYFLSTSRGYNFKTNIGIEKEEKSEKITIVKVGFYQQSRYSIQQDKYFLEETRKDSAYILELLTKRDPRMGVRILVALTNRSNDLFVSRIIDDLRGYYIKSKRFSYWDWFRARNYRSYCDLNRLRCLSRK